MGSPDIMVDAPDERNRPEGVLEAFTNPSTFPHIIMLILVSGFLYLMMKISLFGLDETGSIIFLSLSASYIFAALINPSRIGGALLNVDHESRGIFNFQYWRKSARILTSICIICIIFIGIFYSQLGQYKSSVIIFMSSFFLILSFGQAVSIIYGGVQYSNSRELKIRKSKTGTMSTVFRALIIILAFSPLVWWMGYTSGDPGEEVSYLSLNWFLQLVFLISLALIVVISDRLTSGKRSGEFVDGRATDRFMMFIVAMCSWHLYSAWRRNPFAQDPSHNSILIEEGILMSITIVLAVWSISNRGKEKGWKIFQGQSAMFWGISFGYAYGGSIASLSSISGGFLDLVTITALGHLITALSAIFLLPFTIGLVGFVKKVELVSKDLGSQDKDFGDKVFSDEEMGFSKTENGDEDAVELVD